jgi:hypothetical protein
MPENTLRPPTSYARFVCGWIGPLHGVALNDCRGDPLRAFGQNGCGHEWCAEVPRIWQRLPRCPECKRWRTGIVEVLEPTLDLPGEEEGPTIEREVA